jgi:diguanylate cyclase (GGDEF)-like protein
MPVVGDDIARARCLVALHEALGANEDDLAALVRQATAETAGLLGDACGLWQVDGAELTLEAFSFAGHDVLERAHEYGFASGLPGGLVERVVNEGVPLLSGVVDATPPPVALSERCQAILEAFSFASLVIVPLQSRGTVLGALGVARSVDTPTFDDADISYLQDVARVVALTMANAKLLQEVAESRRQANLLAREDQLTGLLNRRGFLEVLRETPLDRSTLVAVMDMDGFRLVNDGFGHAVGDMVLTSLAARLCASLPPETPVARIGGDEFAVLVQADDEEETAAVVENAAVECTGTLQVVGLSVPISVSVGTAVPLAGSSDQVLQHADLAMSRAKQHGGFLAAYDPDLDDPATRRLREVLDLRRAILGDGLVVHYQPVVPVNGGPLRVEALVRRCVEGELSPPAAWLEIANRAGLMPELTANVVRQVIDQLVTWWGDGLEVECAVNVPAPVLAGPDLVRNLLKVVDDAGLPRRALSVEVTEGELVGAQARAALSRCADADIAVAVDDFGTGWSSLAYLVELPLRTLKLDRSIVDGVDLDPRRATVMRGVVDVAHDLGLRVVAEGVETQDVADVVIDLGADALQGYLYSRPTAGEQLAPLLRTGLVAGHR